MRKKTVAIIGAGVSGLTAIKSCLEYGLEPICFEMKSELGGTWAPVHPRPPGYNAAQAYDDLVTNTSKFQFTFSDFPHSETSSLTLPRRKVLEYLHSYAQHFLLESCIRFSRKVQQLRRADDYETTGRWTVTTSNLENNECETLTVDATILCCGFFSREKLPPSLSDRDAFRRGTMLHAADFWNADVYRDRRVAVVGAGIGGVDVATLLAAGKTTQVYLVAPKGTWLVPLFYKGRCYKYVALDYQRNFETNGDIERVRSSLAAITSWRFNHDALGLSPVGKLLSTDSSIAISNDIDQWIYSGRIKVVRDSVTGFTDLGLQMKNTGVLQVDDVIFATGYRPHYPFLNEPQLFSDVHPHENSYLYLCPIDQLQPTLFTIALMYVQQSVPGLAELMARLFDNQRRERVAVEGRDETVADEDDYPGIVTFHPLRDDLSRLVGCNPDLAEIRRRDSQLAAVLFEGFVTPFVYRLLGPHAKWDLARKAILDADKFGKEDNWDLTELRSLNV